MRYFVAFDSPWRAQDARGVPGAAARHGKAAVHGLPPLRQRARTL